MIQRMQLRNAFVMIELLEQSATWKFVGLLQNWSLFDYMNFWFTNFGIFDVDLAFTKNCSTYSKLSNKRTVSNKHIFCHPVQNFTNKTPQKLARNLPNKLVQGELLPQNK